LQKLGLSKALRLDQLYPVGKQLIARMVAKGWITKQDDGRTYCRTPAGDEALRAIIPMKK
jgi:predicted transcriptional regulator